MDHARGRRDPMDEYEAIRTGTGSVGPLLHLQVRGHGARRRPPDPAPVHELRSSGMERGPGPLRRVRERRRARWSTTATCTSTSTRSSGCMINTAGHRGLVPRDGRRPRRPGRRTAPRTSPMIAVQGPTSQATPAGTHGPRPVRPRVLPVLARARRTVAGVRRLGAADRVLRREGLRGRLGARGRPRRDLGGADRGRRHAVRAHGDRPRPHRGRASSSSRVDYNPGETSPVRPVDGPVHQDRTRSAWAPRRSRPYGANPPKRFKSLQIEGDAAPDYGAAVTKDGDEVGVVTSPAVSPRLGTIALAILDARRRDDGEKVEVAASAVGDGRGRRRSLYDPEKKRPARLSRASHRGSEPAP